MLLIAILHHIVIIANNFILNYTRIIVIIIIIRPFYSLARSLTCALIIHAQQQPRQQFPALLMYVFTCRPQWYLTCHGDITLDEEEDHQHSFFALTRSLFSCNFMTFAHSKILHRGTGIVLV